MGYSKSSQSRVNNQVGKQLEDMILAGCEYYRTRGLAEINRIPEHFRVLKTNRDGSFSGRFTGLAQPDFTGTVKGGGAIVFEAKATLSDRIKSSVISKEQKKKLDHHEQMGARAGVCVRVHNTYAFIPWSVWKDMKKIYGRLYMTESEVRDYSVKTPGFIAFLDAMNGGAI